MIIDMRLLGRFEMRLDGLAVPAFPRPDAAQLAKLLALTPGAVCRRTDAGALPSLVKRRHGRGSARDVGCRCATPVLAATIAPRENATSGGGAMATFVIVHGAWSGPHAWRWVRPLLRAAGHEVVTPSLTGLGERVHLGSPATDLDTHITDVAAVLHYEDLHDVVLVGHSYGGMVITGVADRAPERIGQLVYLDADVPRAGESELDLVPADERAGYEESARTRGEGWKVPPPFPDPLPPGLPPEVVWAVARMVPHPLATLTQPLRLKGEPPDVPRTYVLCTEGKEGEAPPPYLDRVRADPSWRLVELAAGHTAHVTAPEKLSATLQAVAVPG